MMRGGDKRTVSLFQVWRPGSTRVIRGVGEIVALVAAAQLRRGCAFAEQANRETREVAARPSFSLWEEGRLRAAMLARDAMERVERFVKRAALLSGAGATLIACTVAQPVAPYPYYGTAYPYYGTYGGYYGYPSSYYYADPWYDPWFGRPFHRRFHDGRQRSFTHQPQAAPPATPRGAPSGGSTGQQPRGFLGKVLRQHQQQGR